MLLGMATLPKGGEQGRREVQTKEGGKHEVTLLCGSKQDTLCQP